MIILPSRLKLIRDNFFEFSFESEEEVVPSFEIFQSLSSAEQYILVKEYNWDDGTQVLNWIIDSEKCDRGTATMMFWLAEPDFYFDYQTEEDIDEWARDVWRLLQRIVGRFRSNDFTSSRFGFIPTRQGYQTDWDSATGIWELPLSLVKGNEGLKPIALG